MLVDFSYEFHIAIAQDLPLHWQQGPETLLRRRYEQLDAGRNKI
jgi:hypothetical protein